MSITTSSSPGGRPRSFDMDRALDCALDVFWRKGYEGASLSALTKAMGINRPSLYAAFGDKEALFRRVLNRYVDGPSAFVQAALGEKAARSAVERMLREAVKTQTARGNPRGCLLVQGALACGEESEPIRRELIARRRKGEALLRQRLERAKKDGELERRVDTAVLARFYSTVLYGMAVQAAGGASRRDLEALIQNAMRTWPGKRQFGSMHRKRARRARS
jgi:AcrR family transcriptional regulator